MVMPWLRKLPIIKQFADIYSKSTRQRLDLVDGYINLHKQTWDPNYSRDFVDSFLCEMDKQKGDQSNNTYFNEEQLRWVLFDLFIAGIDTTSTTIHWIFSFLSAHPQCQVRAQQEVDQVLGTEGRPSYTTRSSLPYIQAIIQEIFRMRPVFPLGIPRKTKTNVDFMGYKIPKGTPVFANLWAVHNDPAIWIDPEEFRPERHISSTGEFMPSDKIIPFSTGVRLCPGKLVAQTTIYIILIKTLQRFTLSFPPDQSNPNLDGTSLFALSPRKIRILFTER